MLPRLKPATFLSIALSLLLQSSCGDGSSEPAEVSLAEASAMESTASYKPQPVGGNHCTEKAPLDDEPVTYCKTLEDGSIPSVTLKPSTYVQDPETCVITVVDDGIKTTILEMGFEACDN